jgi:hypothetical protein
VGGAGWRLFSSSLAKMKSSIGVCTQAVFLTLGGADFRTG